MSPNLGIALACAGYAATLANWRHLQLAYRGARVREIYAFEDLHPGIYDLLRSMCP